MVVKKEFLMSQYQQFKYKIKTYKTYFYVNLVCFFYYFCCEADILISIWILGVSGLLELNSYDFEPQYVSNSSSSDSYGHTVESENVVLPLPASIVLFSNYILILNGESLAR